MSAAQLPLFDWLEASRRPVAPPRPAPAAPGLTFYLGSHKPAWLWDSEVPLFVSDVTLRRVQRLRPAATHWALDSGGFTELSQHGTWTQTPEEYAARTRRYQQEIGKLDFAAIQDWMCEEVILQKTGLSVPHHQMLTVTSFLALKSLAPEIPWLPVLQGWTPGDYLDCLELYARYGVDLTREPRVGLGTVCRRQSTVRAEMMIHDLAVNYGLKLHGFGFKTEGLLAAGSSLASADSLAWSFHARKRPPLSGCSHANCANCRVYALRWRQSLLEAIASGDEDTGYLWRHHRRQS
jgi:hypothetical protein